MNINELDSYNLADAVKFHSRLNPRIWGRDEHLLPEVHDKLLAIAADFQEFLGVEDLDVQDITISGSNAAYSYTKNSDIDLHLVVNMPDNPVYQELFNAKKYQYNDEHNIKIGGADVELYVQPVDQAHHSQGIYSVRDNEWRQVPQRKRARIDDACVRDKVSDLDARIHSAIKSKDLGRISTLWSKIKVMRQTGLEQHGEFGCENIAFKMLRNSGCIAALKDAKTALQDRELSLREAAKPQKKFRYGYGSIVAEASTPDGVSDTTCMFLNEGDEENLVHEFIQHVAMELGIDPMPEIHLHTDPEWSTHNHSFGRYDPDSHTLNVSLPNRHILDVLRTVAHELVHCSQNQQHGGLPADAGETGSRWENDANARAGIIMRDWANEHPEHFDLPALAENASGYIPKNKREAAQPQYAMALSVDIKPGQTGKEANKLALNTGRNGEPGLLMKTANLREYRMPQPSHGPGKYRDLNEPLGPETPPEMPDGTIKVDVSDMYDWYKLGQKISDLGSIKPGELGQGPPSTVFAFGSEDLENQYSHALTRLGLKTHDLDEPGEEDLDESIDADQVLHYVKKTHAPEEFNIEYSITDHPSWQLVEMPLSQLHLDPDGEVQDPYNRTNWVDYDTVNDLIPKIAQVLKSKPIVVDSDGWIIDGNHRAMAAAEAGLTSVPALVPVEVKEDVTESREEFEGITIEMIKNGHVLVVNALDDWGNKVLGHVKFNIGDGKELDPQDLRVDDKYQGQGIARVMYDYVKSLGYTINRSWDQTDAGAGFWNKHRGEDVRVWEQGMAEGLEDNGISFKVQKGKNKFATTLSVGGNPVGVYQYDATTGRSIAEVYPEFKGKGLGKLLVLHAIYTAAKLGLDFQEDESRTSEYDNVLDSLSSNGYIVDDDGYWYVTGEGEQYLKQSMKQGVAEARKNPEQNTKYQSGWAELAAWASKNNVWLKPHEWAISMTYVPKLGINPGPGISEDTPRGIYFYPFHWAYSVKMDKEALPWADNAPYIQLFQYSTGTELYDPNQIPLASVVAQLKNYGITDEDIAAEKENYPGISTYNLLVWCLGRKYDDNKRVSILNKVLRNLGYDSMIDNGKGWIAINEPTQGVVLNPKIIDKVVTFNNYTRKKEQGVAEDFLDEGLRVDVPNEEWLQNAIDYAKQKSPDRNGLPYMGKTTATVRSVDVPVNILKRIPGMRREQQNVRQADLAAIVKIMSDTGKLPLHGHTGEEYKPFINVAYDGSAWVNEGNHRIMAAAKLGWETLPVEISYFDGGERVESGAMYPGKIGLGQVSENFADGKNPGRKGLSKRMGVNTKASVSSLRKTAKNSSGEKQRMAHWLANMKSGRAKAKRK